jgi:hypothetical protein
MGATSNTIDGDAEKGGAVAGELIGALPHNIKVEFYGSAGARQLRWLRAQT